MKQRRFYELDACKGIAACGIAFCWHYQHFRPAASPYSQILSFFYSHGLLAVEFFFLLSGFVMMYVYEQKLRNNQVSLRQYMGKRIGHLYPLVFVTLIVTAAIQIYNLYTVGQTFVYSNTTPLYFFLNLLMLNYGVVDINFSFNGPSWCIPIELICYFILFFVISRARKNKQNEYAWMIGFVLLSLFLICMGWKYPILNFEMGRGIGCFFIGCILCKLYQYLVRADIATKIGVLIFSLLVGTMVLTWFFPLEFPSRVEQRLFTIFFVAPAITLSALTVPPLRWVLRLKPLVYLGKISFSLYMWHFPVQLALDTCNRVFGWGMNASQKKFFWIYVIVSLAMAVFSCEVLEKWVRKLMMWFVTPRKAVREEKA